MKCNDTEAAVAELVAAAGPEVPVVCLQNGVEAERIAARRLSNVYATPVRLPATHLDPGVVQANSAPYSGVLDIGRYPLGADELCSRIADALEASRFSARPEPRVMRHKYTKLLGINLGNAIEALTGERSPRLLERAQQEARACFAAASIDYASEQEDRERRGNYVRILPIAGARRGGGSTWQSLSRGKRAVEVDYLNGEIVLLGRLHGVPTPVNALLQERANHAAFLGHAPGSVTVAELEEAVG